jgi:hypothetical protein
LGVASSTLRRRLSLASLPRDSLTGKAVFYPTIQTVR